MSQVPGSIVLLNGAPRAGKSSIARVIQERFEGIWMNLGVDTFSRCVVPTSVRPGIGLRPGGERPDLEPLIPELYGAMYESIAAHSRRGLHVVADVSHHDDYSRPLGVLPAVARVLEGLPAFFIGVRCSSEVILERRQSDPVWQDSNSALDRSIPDAVDRWQAAVHRPGIYDLEVDTSSTSPEDCAVAINVRLQGPAPTALEALRAGWPCADE